MSANTPQSNSKPQTKEEWKARMKEIKEEKKRVKKLQREEEILQQRTAPKYTRLQVVKAEQVVQLKSTNQKIEQKVPKLTTEEFPDLVKERPQSHIQKSSKLPTFCAKLQSSVRNDEEAFPVLGSSKVKEEKTIWKKEISSTRMKNEEIIRQTPSVEQNVIAPVDLPSSSTAIMPITSVVKGRRSKHPIMVPLVTVIKDKTKNKKQQKSSSVLGSKINKTVSYRVVGNSLDADHPLRRKGKIKENKKPKRLSPLKTIIIKERIIRRIAKKEALKQLRNSNVETENHKQLEDTNIQTENHKQLEDINIETKDIEERGSMNVGINLKEEIVKYLEDNRKPEKTKKKKKERIVLTQNNNFINFSRTFREYCDNIITSELNTAVQELIGELVRFQDRQFAKNEIKANLKRRHICGIHQTLKYLKLKKIKMIIIAPDLEKCASKGGLMDVIEEIKKEASNANVLCVFALNRRVLGRLALKHVPVSVFTVLDYSGAEDKFIRVVNELKICKEEFVKRLPTTEVEKEVTTEVINTVISKLSISTKSGTQEEEEEHSNPFMQALMKVSSH